MRNPIWSQIWIRPTASGWRSSGLWRHGHAAAVPCLRPRSHPMQCQRLDDVHMCTPTECSSHSGHVCALSLRLGRGSWEGPWRGLIVIAGLAITDTVPPLKKTETKKNAARPHMAAMAGSAVCQTADGRRSELWLSATADSAPAPRRPARPRSPEILKARSSVPNRKRQGAGTRAARRP